MEATGRVYCEQVLTPRDPKMFVLLVESNVISLSLYCSEMKDIETADYKSTSCPMSDGTIATISCAIVLGILALIIRISGKI